MRMRKYYPVAVLMILLVAIALSASLVTTNANALPTFTLAAKGIGPCQSCHTKDATHAVVGHASFVATCSTCHVTNVATPPKPTACAACHGGVSAIIAKTTHAATGCGTTPGCHGVAALITVTSFTPASGRTGTVVTVAGTGFTGATKVTFGGVAATVFTPVSATQITAKVPSRAVTGRIVVTSPSGTGTSATRFKVKAKIVKLSPTAGKRRVIVTITGTGFGAKRATSFVKFGAAKASTYISWSRTLIKCRVPATARFGALLVKVTVAAGTSNGKAFWVRR